MLRLSILAGGGIELGQAVFLEESQPVDLTVYGKRYLRSGNVETDTNLFDTTLFTSKKIGALTSRTSQFGATSIKCAAFGSNTFVIAGNSGKVSTSSDGITWVAQTPPHGSAINDIAFGAGLFVIVSNGGLLYTSSDGVSWTSRTSGFGADNISKVDFANGKFYAQGVIAGNIRISTSDDGIAWSLLAQVIAAGSPAGVAYQNATYVLVSDAGVAFTSADGITWASNAGLAATNCQSLAGGNDMFVTCGTTGQLYSSFDGLTWSAETATGFSGTLFAAYYDGTFVISGGNRRIFSSTTGEDPYLVVNSGAALNYTAIASGNGAIVIAGDSGELLSADLEQYAGSKTAHAENSENQYIRIS